MATEPTWRNDKPNMQKILGGCGRRETNCAGERWRGMWERREKKVRVHDEMVELT